MDSADIDRFIHVPTVLPIFRDPALRKLSQVCMSIYGEPATEILKRSDCKKLSVDQLFESEEFNKAFWEAMSYVYSNKSKMFHDIFQCNAMPLHDRFGGTAQRWAYFYDIGQEHEFISTVGHWQIRFANEHLRKQDQVSRIQLSVTA